MTLNDLKWLQMSLYVSKKSTVVIWIHLKSFVVMSWGNKTSYTINMQCSLSFFVGSQTQCGATCFTICYQQLLTLHISSRCKAPLYWEPPSIWHHYHHRQQHTVAGWIVGIHCHTTVVLFGNSFLSWRLVLDFNESQEPHRSIIQWRWVYLNKIFWSNRHSREFSIYEPSSLDDKSSFNQEIALLRLGTAEDVMA